MRLGPENDARWKMLLRRRTVPQQQDPFLRELIDRVEARFTQEELEAVSGIPRSVYVRMRAGANNISWQAIDAWLGAVGYRAKIGRQMERRPHGVRKRPPQQEGAR